MDADEAVERVNFHPTFSLDWDRPVSRFNIEAQGVGGTVI